MMPQMPGEREEAGAGVEEGQERGQGISNGQIHPWEAHRVIH